ALPGGPAGGAAPPPDPLARLPHGPEFRFLTRAVTARAGEAAEAVWTLTGAEPFFAGHFPGNPVVPGVLIVEAMAQAAGLAVPAAANAGGPAGGMLVHVDVRFEQPVVPPADVVIRAQHVRTVGGLSLFNVTASVGPVVAARGSVTLNCSPVVPAPVGGRA
ncbi:MAG: putative (3R)-hydroxymyristoyl-[acyl-carrier-protein] dehydratase, partial [Phycisphaerales bacterium]|nr:putative (3R)-hydroxymyristoyl-[acyl-carrier-protein] dehydratase [Phycisphaerales bacterium]